MAVNQEIDSIFPVNMLWSTIPETEFDSYQLVNFEEAPIIKAYIAKSRNHTLGIITLHDFGSDADTIEDIYNSYKLVSEDKELIKEHGFKVLLNQNIKVGKLDCLVCVLRSVDINDSCTFDIYFELGGRVYNFHTVFLDESNFVTVDSIKRKNKHIAEVFNMVENANS